MSRTSKRSSAIGPQPDLTRLLAAGAATALCVAGVLVPSESAADSGTASPVVLLWILLFTIVMVVAAVRKRLDLTGSKTSIAALTFAAAVALSSLVMLRAASARPVINLAWVWTSLVVSLFVVRAAFQSAVQCRALCAVMISLAVGLAVLGYVQTWITLPPLRERVLKNLDESMRLANLDPTDPIVREQFRGRLAVIEPMATFALTNSLAGFLAPWLVLLIGMACGLRSWSGQRTRLATFGLFAALLAGCLLLTHSRTACLAVAAGLFGIWKFDWHRQRRLGWKVPAGAIGLVGIAAAVSLRVSADAWERAIRSLTFRFDYWRASWQMICERPLFGCGPGNFQDFYPRYKLPVAPETVADPHNFIVEIWATCGTLALLTFLVLLGCFFRDSLRADRTSPPADHEHSPPGNLAAIYAGLPVGFLVAGIGGLLVGFAPDPQVWLIVLPVAAACLAGLHGWVTAGELPAPLLAIAAAVLLVNFCAAGGIAYLGVAQPLWLFVAIAPRLASSEPGNAGRVPTARVHAAAWGLASVGAALLIVCHRTAFTPNVARIAAMSAASRSTSYAEHEDRLLAAAAADVWSPEPVRHLAEIRVQRWAHDPTPKRWNDFEQSLREFKRRDRQSFLASRLIGRWYVTLWRASGSRQHLQTASDAFDDAVRLHPTNALLWAQLAWCRHEAGDRESANRAAREALRLDSIQPDAHRQLSRLHVFTGATVTAGSASSGETAEEMMSRLSGN